MAVNSKKDIAYEPLYSDSSSKSFESVPHDEDERTLFDGTMKRSARSKPYVSVGIIALTALNSLLLIATLIVLQLSNKNQGQCHESRQCTEEECAAMTSQYSTLLEPGAGVIEYEQVMFQGHLDHKNIYKGTPNKAMDKAWDDLMYMNGTVVDAKVIDRIGKSRLAVKFTEQQEPGEKYFASVEVFHQLHCLNLIRTYTYREYYDRPENRPLAFEDPEHILRKHVDHCIDMLRQVLSCNADVGLITYNWVEHYGIFPDFSTQHKCRKLDNIIKWVDTHQSASGLPAQSKDSVWLSESPP
ncbi:hypothetical protein FP744_10000864 [Trichoderma asperellum]|nr:hypothetical protein LI328DRAFT_168430 [Trichoderma asperelloides]